MKALFSSARRVVTMSVLVAARGLASLSVGIAGSVADAQGLQSRAYPIPELVQSFVYQSASMGERYAINVAIPTAFKTGDARRYGALIVVDGDRAFPGVLNAYRSLESTIAPIFVISIGTPQEDGRDAYTRRRQYEFSPPNWDRKDPFGEFVTESCQKTHADMNKCTGGAPKFLNAIVNEILPLVEAKFPVDHNRLGLYGGSAGGFFATWTIFQPNSPFKRYLLSSPAMAQGNGVVFRDEEQYAKTHTDLPVWIYMGAGTLEAADPIVEGLGLVVSGISRMTAALSGRHYPGLKIVTEYHPGMGHADAGGASIARGLRTLYPRS